jgi:hypothetical protein
MHGGSFVPPCQGRRCSLGPFAVPAGNERPKINQISRPRWLGLLELGSRGGKWGQALKFLLYRPALAYSSKPREVPHLPPPTFRHFGGRALRRYRL